MLAAFAVVFCGQARKLRRTVNAREKTKEQNLVRHGKSGRYYAPLATGGKEVWNIFRATRFFIATARLAEFALSGRNSMTFETSLSPHPMKTCLHAALFLILISTLRAEFGSDNGPSDSDDLSDDLSDGQSKILQISATIDGSDRIVFSGQTVRLEHKYWDMPRNIKFDGKPWTDLSHTPPGWSDIAAHLDLTKAHIISRRGRDVIALETTRRGFDLYFCDSPNGAADYSVTISIPQRD
ncbi:MAG: hypothetical protein ABSE62_08415 [Chthoniobacteraceae bacterium]|jgi:hypothetical protein